MGVLLDEFTAALRVARGERRRAHGVEGLLGFQSAATRDMGRSRRKARLEGGGVKRRHNEKKEKKNKTSSGRGRKTVGMLYRTRSSQSATEKVSKEISTDKGGRESNPVEHEKNRYEPSKRPPGPDPGVKSVAQRAVALCMAQSKSLR